MTLGPTAGEPVSIAVLGGGGFLGSHLVDALLRHTGHRVIVVDTSQSQSQASLRAARSLVAGLLGRLEATERFAVLACDTGCVGYPASGMVSPSRATRNEALAWLAHRLPGGASDVAGSIGRACTRLAAGRANQVVYVGDGIATAGRLAPHAVACAVRTRLESCDAELRVEHRFATWDLREWHPEADFAVTVLRKPSSAP